MLREVASALQEVMVQRLWCRDYAAGGSRDAAGLSKPVRSSEFCGRSDDAAEVMLQNYVAGSMLQGRWRTDYCVGITLQGIAAMLQDSSNSCVLECPVAAVTMLRR